MDINKINTNNKTITLPLSEYLDIIDEDKNKNYYKILGKVIKSINLFKEYIDVSDEINKEDKNFVKVRLNQAIKANGLEIDNGYLFEHD